MYYVSNTNFLKHLTPHFRRTVLSIEGNHEHFVEEVNINRFRVYRQHDLGYLNIVSGVAWTCMRGVFSIRE